MPQFGASLLIYLDSGLKTVNYDCNMFIVQTTVNYNPNMFIVRASEQHYLE
jgi:hypothetical protein